MESILCSVIICTITSLLAVFAGVYLYFKEQYKFWKKLNVPYMPASFPMGSVSGIGSKIGLTEFIRYLYEQNSGKSVAGIYTISKPQLLVRDPEILRLILIKDFMTFHDRGVFVNERDDPLGAHLFGIGGVKWRNLRAKLSPTFTSGKMKMMFPILLECSEELKDLLKGPASRGETVEMKDVAARFTTDIISSCAFGIQTNSMKNPNAIFRAMGKKFFEISFWKGLKLLFITACPELGRRFRMTFTPGDVAEFFIAAVKDTIDYREKNNIERKDFLQLLIQLKNKGRLEDVDETETETLQQDEESNKFTFLDAAAQAFSFYAAGFETSSTTTQFALYELAVNPDIQDQLREEIRDTIAINGGLTYEGIHSMQYLGRVIDETLRKYPPVTGLQRESNKDFRIPNTDWVIPKGIVFHIPVLGLHHDPQYYPNPEKFDPDRFTEEGKSSRPGYVYLPFGEGPRNCIGMRFGLMQTRLGLATLISNFRFEVSEKTMVPLKMDKNSFVLSPEGGMHLKITTLT